MASVMFNDIKQNMLAWYPFHAKDRCLVVGDSDGIVTHALSDTVQTVIRVQDFGECLQDEVFDVVIIYGGISRDVLKQAKCRMTGTGKMLVWSDNRIGLRYMSGTMDQNTHRYFSGCNDYVDNKGIPYGYTRQEMCRMIESAGYSDYKFYYPYPNEVFVKEVFTDATLAEFEYGKEYYNYESGTLELFSEARMAKSLRDEGIIAYFANCFWVELKAADSFCPLIYGKVNSFRKKQFQIVTSIYETDGVRSVEKRGLNLEAIKHVKKMLSHNKPWYLKECADGITCHYFTSDNMDSIVGRYIVNGDVAGVFDAIGKVYQRFFDQAKKSDYLTPDFFSVFGNTADISDEVRHLETICPANIDMICGNIVSENDEYCFIDNEWVFEFDIPILFILWRCIRELYATHIGLAELISYNEFLRHYHIDSKMDEVFLAWATHFVKVYVGTGLYETKSIPRINVDLRSFYLNNCNAAESKVYYDRGEGYSEEDICVAMLQTDGEGKFSLTFPVPEGVRRIRWTPVKDRYCNCKILEINCRVISHNGSESEMGQTFDNGDPQYVLMPPADENRELHINGRIYIRDLMCSARGYLDQIHSKDHVIAVTGNDLEKYKNSLQEAERQKAELQDALHQEKDTLMNIQTQYNELQMQYDNIIHSRSWKIVTFIKKILKK